MAERLPLYKEDFKPTFRPERLEGVPGLKLKKPSDRFTIQGNKSVFVCSMGELFGPWVHREHTEAILSTVAQCPNYDFLFGAFLNQ
jgi:hypothetical protein